MYRRRAASHAGRISNHKTQTYKTTECRPQDNRLAAEAAKNYQPRSSESMDFAGKRIAAGIRTLNAVFEIRLPHPFEFLLIRNS